MSKPLYLVTTLDGSDLDKIDPRTVAERYSNLETCNFFGHTQVWQWGDGDAVVVIVNRMSESPKVAVIIRVGDIVKTIVCGGLTMAMEAMGLNPKEYKLQ
jgi:hypothetical protein